MGRKKSHGRGRGFAHKDSGVPVNLGTLAKHLASEEEVKRRLEDREARAARKFRENKEKRERLRAEWETEKQTRMQDAGLPLALLEKFRPHSRGFTFAERLHSERQDFDAWVASIIKRLPEDTVKYRLIVGTGKDRVVGEWVVPE